MIFTLINYKMNSVSLKLSRRSGFTLIELLTVIAIIGILAAIIIPTVAEVKIAANKAKTKAMFSQWSLAMDLFKSDYGYYPAIGTSSKVVPASFFGALTGKSYTGATLSGENLKGNSRKLSFYTAVSSDVDSSGNLVDAFGNIDFAFFTDSNGDGIINSTDSLSAVSVTAPDSSSGVAPNSTTLDTTVGVRAGVIFYSAGKGRGPNDIVTSW